MIPWIVKQFLVSTLCSALICAGLAPAVPIRDACVAPCNCTVTNSTATAGSPADCFDHVTCTISSQAEGCCTMSSCGPAQNCSAYLSITAYAKDGQSCVFTISGPNGQTTDPNGSKELNYQDTWSKACGRDSTYNVTIAGVVQWHVQMFCVMCAG